MRVRVRAERLLSSYLTVVGPLAPYLAWHFPLSPLVHVLCSYMLRATRRALVVACSSLVVSAVDERVRCSPLRSRM